MTQDVKYRKEVDPMNTNRLYTFLTFCLIMTLAIISCKKAEEKAPRGEVAAPTALSQNEPGESSKSVADESGGIKERHAEKEKKDDRQGLAGHFLAPMEFAGERLLEYKVDLTYESGDLSKSRRQLLGIVSKYGFIKGSTATLEEKTPFVASDIFVKSEKLYDALLELDSMGALLAENISVTDHTEEMALNERTVKREILRIARKNAASAQVAPAAKNWNEIESSLSQSEDKLDASEHAKWKIRDKVAWAWIHVNLKGPDQPGRINVPRYGDAFVGMINMLLGLLYVIIYLLPFAIVIGLIIWKRKQIVTLFQRKKNS